MVINGIDYRLMVPPIEFNDYKDLNKKEAEIYFQWYISEIDKRISQLEKIVHVDDNSIQFDFSPESLIPLWGWYEGKIMLEKKTKEEMEQEILFHSEYVKKFNERKTPKEIRLIVLESFGIEDTKISIQTLALCMDIAIYFAETVRKNNCEKIHWGYVTKPKNHASINEPVLLGFNGGVDLDPRHIIHVCTLRSIDEKNNNELYDTYNIWIDDMIE
ncbi:MAG: hypothetical protein FWF42_03690 [Streptococcaceae bacterium]|nr:hypothetical protein [Streptococcaceae bacterium]